MEVPVFAGPRHSRLTLTSKMSPFDVKSAVAMKDFTKSAHWSPSYTK